MAKKFKKMKSDDFDSLLDSLGSTVPEEEKKQKPITEKDLLKKKEKTNDMDVQKVEEVKAEETKPVEQEVKKQEEVASVEISMEVPTDLMQEDILAPSADELASEPEPVQNEIEGDSLLFPNLDGDILAPAENVAQVQEKPKKTVSSKEEIKHNIKIPVVSTESKKTLIEGLSDFAKNHTKEELNDYGKKRLQEITYGEEMEETLFPLVCQDLYGFKGILIGDKGGLKGEFIDDLSQLLYDIGKTSSPKYEKVPFSEMPEKFTTDKLYIIEDLNDAIINLFNLDDLTESSSITQQSYRNKMEALIKSPGSAYILLNAIDTEVKGFLTLDARLPFLFARKATFQNLSNEAIAERFINALPDFHKQLVNQEFIDKTVVYLERNRRYFPFDNQELANYLANYTSRFQELKLPKEKYNDKTLEESFKSIVGMAVVKKQISELNEYLQIRQKLEKAGIKLPPFNLHMMFLGNPGVGKTTIARIIAKVLFDLGYIREEKLVEVTSKDLVSAYGNQTGVKTNKVIMSAMGGVLFIDEAYSLAISCGQSGLEAIANIIKAMEDYKNDLVVMFAGYSLEMQEFVRSNSGIASRISYVFEFSDYTTEELFQIFEIKLANTGMKFGESAKDPVMKLCKFAAGRRNFGNGRFVDKLLQRALTKHATLNLPPNQMLTLVKDSIPEVEEIMASFGRFGA